MYEKFGNFDSVEEINGCAGKLLKDGKNEEVRKLAEENGITEWFTDSYIAGETEELTDWMNAAIGKLDVEAGGHKDRYVPVQPGADYLKRLCIEEQFARRVRRRTKSMEACMAYVEERTGKLVKEGTTCIPDLTVFRWARDYFMEEGAGK